MAGRPVVIVSNRGPCRSAAATTARSRAGAAPAGWCPASAPLVPAPTTTGSPPRCHRRRPRGGRRRRRRGRGLPGRTCSTSTPRTCGSPTTWCATRRCGSSTTASSTSLASPLRRRAGADGAGTPTARSTGASPRRWSPRSRPTAPPCSCRTTTCASRARCCAGRGPTCGSVHFSHTPFADARRGCTCCPPDPAARAARGPGRPPRLRLPHRALGRRLRGVL